jgi:hypothetical protein
MASRVLDQTKNHGDFLRMLRVHKQHGGIY